MESVEVVPYRREYRDAFARLNLAWIEEFFTVEDADREVFADPERKILDPGGQIFFVIEDGRARGTCAVIRQSESTFELAKMAVEPDARGRGFGDLLIQAAIRFAEDAGADEIVLSSNTRLQPALRLYAKYGFEQIPHDSDTRYQRVDIMMRRALSRHEAT